MGIHLAVFDIIGTTVQAGDEVPSSFRKAFSGVGISLSQEAIATIRGRSKREAISDLLSANGVTAGALEEKTRVVYDRFQQHLRKALTSSARPIPGSQEVFGFLGGMGIKVVLTTGLDRETVQALVQGLGWDGLGLTGLLSGDDVAKGRPAPDLIHAAMRLARLDDPGTVLVVGDTTADLEAAAAAQVGWSVGVLTGAHSRVRLEGHPHSVILESVADLPGWLATEGAVQSGTAQDPG